MQQIDIYLSTLVSYPQFAQQIIERAMENDGVTEKNIASLKSMANQLILARRREHVRP